jgi:hypothetical protein
MIRTFISIIFILASFSAASAQGKQDPLSGALGLIQGVSAADRDKDCKGLVNEGECRRDYDSVIRRIGNLSTLSFGEFEQLAEDIKALPKKYRAGT